MPIARSKVTAQGQISVPAEIRRKLGIAPGATIEWHEQDGEIVVRRAGRHTSEDIHRAVFRTRPPGAHSLRELKHGIRNHVKARRARS